ncbi:DsbA family protein [Halomarina halobia]|uniref:DsbA family protein n=1 Tax=Halomarina halobia TaxID=3033386 RepID=A0ABD6A6I0_9EURY|nr:thioredoxin domain-containing protein [Halomarina sp. PSR21]
MENRRAFLAGVGLAASGALAGCLGLGGGRSETDLDAHPAAAGATDEPRLGPPLEEARAVIVAFEDPSCTTCRRFETTTFPRIESDLVGSGEVAFVYRLLPIVFPWGEPAAQALEATYDRSAEAFWALKAHYYAEQDAFGSDTVLDRTGAFLARETDVDAAGVVADAREERFDDRVREDVRAAEEAGASATPTFYLFREGEFLTRAVGAKDYAVFERALGG